MELNAKMLPNLHTCIIFYFRASVKCLSISFKPKLSTSHSDQWLTRLPLTSLDVVRASLDSFRFSTPDVRDPKSDDLESGPQGGVDQSEN